MERVKANDLVMKLSDAEWQWDRKKLTLYFTAEKRVDFRELVKELAKEFHTRIEMRQIGIRDEARQQRGRNRVVVADTAQNRGMINAAAFAKNYANPLYRLPITFVEMFPVGVLISLVSAALLRNSRFLPAR